MSGRRASSASILSTWTDAFGTRRRVAPATRVALAAAMEGDERGGRSRPEPIILARRGDPLPRGGQLVLEDGTALGRASRIPADVPWGYHRIRTRRGEQLVILAPPRCVLPARYRE
jgi:hypothetical protein